MTFDVSLLPVLVSTVGAITIGALWYSSYLFGPTWMKEAGLHSLEVSTEEMGKAILLGALQNFALIYILAYLIGSTTTVPPATFTVLIVLLVASSHLGAVIWEKRSVTYFAITVGYLAVVLLASTLVIVKWPWA